MDTPAKEWLLSFRAKWEGANVGESIGTQTMDVMIQDIQNLLTTHSARLVERLMPWLEHDTRCILQQNERGEPMEDGGYRTMYAGVWYKRGEEPKCDCGLDQAIDIIKNKTE